jgi:hypothetical protein
MNTLNSTMFSEFRKNKCDILRLVVFTERQRENGTLLAWSDDWLPCILCKGKTALISILPYSFSSLATTHNLWSHSRVCLEGPSSSSDAIFVVL